jgi:hypothetical protein
MEQQELTNRMSRTDTATGYTYTRHEPQTRRKTSRDLRRPVYMNNSPPDYIRWCTITHYAAAHSPVYVQRSSRFMTKQVDVGPEQDSLCRRVHTNKLYRGAIVVLCIMMVILVTLVIACVVL